MSGNFDGGRELYGAVIVSAFVELSRLLNKPGQERRAVSHSWKRVALGLAVIATPLVLLLAGSLHS